MTDEDWKEHYWGLTKKHVRSVARQDVYDALPPALRRRPETARGKTMLEAVEALLERPLTDEERATLWEKYDRNYNYWGKKRTGRTPPK